MIPFGQPVNDKLSHAYTPAGNTFAVGFIMYQLMTLDGKFPCSFQSRVEFCLPCLAPVVTLQYSTRWQLDHNCKILGRVAKNLCATKALGCTSAVAPHLQEEWQYVELSPAKAPAVL